MNFNFEDSLRFQVYLFGKVIGSRIQTAKANAFNTKPESEEY